MGLSRRDIMKMSVLGAAAVALPLERYGNAAIVYPNRMPRSRLPKPFTVPFARPPVAKPVRSDATTDYYRLSMRQTAAEILPGVLTPVWSYGGSVPGPTIRARQGRRTVVRQINSLPGAHPTLGYSPWTSVHLHGSASLPQYDGYASDITNPGQYKDYQYPNFQPARTLWYHDHGVHHTAENVYMGLAGQYHLLDARERALPIPHGEFDVPLTISDKMFTTAGLFLINNNDESGIFGDVITVNGRPWPRMRVKRRKYRFRILNASVGRSYELQLSNGDPLTCIGTDGGLMPRPQRTGSLLIGQAERYEVVIDFAKYRAGTRITLRNLRPDNNIEFADTDKVMAFDVVDDPFSTAGNSVPAALDLGNEVMNLRPADAVTTRRFDLVRDNGMWTINGRTWQDVVDSNFTYAEAKPRLGDTEIWEIRNDSGGWFHPLHIHLVDFKVLSRNGQPPRPYERGPKDVVYVGENETVRLIMRFDGLGRYMMHCHNLVHEDHDMMTQFWVVGPNGEEGWTPFADPCHHLPQEPL